MYQTILHYPNAVLWNKIISVNSCINFWKTFLIKKKIEKQVNIKFLVELKKPGGGMFNVLCWVDGEWLQGMLQCMDGWDRVMCSFWWKSLWVGYYVYVIISLVKYVFATNFVIYWPHLNSDFVLDSFKLVHCNSVERIFIIKSLALFQQKLDHLSTLIMKVALLTIWKRNAYWKMWSQRLQDLRI